MPHVCGDEPQPKQYNLFKEAVCPTYVGMNRDTERADRRVSRMPHVCGDEPYIALDTLN